MPPLASVVFKVHCFLKALSHLQKNVQATVVEREIKRIMPGLCLMH